MTADQLFNDKLTDFQLKALEALHSIMTETASPAPQDPARAKVTLQFLNVRLRSALALLRFKPRKVPVENASKRVETNHASEPAATTPPIDALIPFISALLPSPSPLAPPSQTRALLEHAGMPQHVPRPVVAA